MSERTKTALLSEIETLLGQYPTHGTEHTGTVMVAGFVFAVGGRTFKADGDTVRLYCWGAGEDQDTHQTLGMALGMAENAKAWYADVMDYGGDDDDD